MSYTTQSLVLAELGVASSVVTASSIPSSSDISTWISQAKADIDRRTGRVWESTSISSSVWEYHDYDGTGWVKLFNTPVLSIERIDYEANGVGGESESWVTLTSGRDKTGDYLLYKDIGIVEFHSNTNNHMPRSGQQNVRVAYTYGETTVPDDVQRLATLLVADRYMRSFVNNSASQLGGSVSVGTISVTDPSSFSISRLREMRDEIERLYSGLGTLKTSARNYSWGSW